MAQLLPSPLRHHPEDWKRSNLLHYSSAERDRAGAERLRAETVRMCKAVDSQTVKTRSDVENKLAGRIRDIKFWKEELERKIEENSAETELLCNAKAILEETLRSTNFPHEVANACLSYREGRIDIDLVHDDVEIQLKKEVEVIVGVQGMLQRSIDQCTEQIRLLKSVKYQLNKDLKDKFSALDLDGTCLQLKTTSEHLNHHKGIAKIPSDSFTPEQWEDYSNVNILKSEKHQNASATLRGVVTEILDQANQDILLQRQTVDRAFEKRIKEVQEAYDSLTNHLEKVKQEISEMERNIESLRAAIEDKIGPMKLAQTRLQIRSRRPRQELVRDPVQYKLVGEVSQISDNVERMQALLAENEKSLKELLCNQLSLEEDISVKANSLTIDKQQCCRLREQLTFSPSN